MTQTTPAIPPRPSRSPNLASSSKDFPRVPPRPSARRHERSLSPSRDPYAPSPLNEPPNGSNPNSDADDHHIKRPPSVNLPSLGEEGREYDDLAAMEEAPDKPGMESTETRTVGNDLKIHAPRPSLPQSSAKARMQAVTRTDSAQAAAAGFGKPGSPGSVEPERQGRPTHHKPNVSRTESSAASSERRKSLHPDEHGQKVPMYPSAGDVQAPSPSPYFAEHEQQHTHRGRGHNRSRSGRDHSLPPGSYGLHGHGINPNDRFEKAWYEKHPKEYQKEEGQYASGVGAPRPDWAMSSDDLNKIVRSSAMKGSGLGTSPAVTATPEEEIGYIASEEYASRLATPGPDSRRTSQQVSDSPPKDAKAPVSHAGAEEQKPTALHTELAAVPSEKADVIHVDDPYHPLHHPDGFAPAPDPEEQAGAAGEEDVDDREPILAPDEVRPESAFLHPVVSPTFDKRSSVDLEDRTRTSSASRSRPTSRPAIHRRVTSHEEREETSTPLEDVEEYEPLFPEDDKEKVVSPAERFKQRPDVLKHKFPSEDIWEDSPNSLQLQATVTTPDIPKPETPEQNAAQKEQASAAAKTDSHPDDHPEKPPRPDHHFKQRFPSRDIWEDAPESQTLVTTIEPSEGDTKSPEVPSKPNIPVLPQKRPQQPQQPASEVNSSATAAKPATSPTEERKPPAVPGRPKPQIPTRPAKPATRGSSEGLTKVTSAGSASSTEESKEKEVPATKSKPPVPTRPVGSKIAALQAGFLSDLNSRLQLGPQGPRPQTKQEEKEEAPAEKAPLNDARKSRARGPARRKPAAETTTSSKSPTIPEVKITGTWNVWQINKAGSLIVGDDSRSDEKETRTKRPSAPDVSLSPENTMAPALAMNAAGESVDPQPHAAEESVSASSTSPAKEAEQQLQQRQPIPSEQTEPTSPPAANSARSPSPQPVLAKTVSSNTTKADEARSPTVEPSVPSSEQDVPKVSSPNAESDIQIDTKPSPELVSDAVENVEAFTGKKVSELNVHTDERE